MLTNMKSRENIKKEDIIRKKMIQIAFNKNMNNKYGEYKCTVEYKILSKNNSKCFG